MTEPTGAPPRPGTLSTAYFTDLYAGSPDPWGLEAGWYEERKRACLLAALPARRARRGFEPGCANGAVSELLVERCDELLCWDPAARAVAAARQRLAGRSGVRVEQGSVPGRWPSGTFDLIVASEMVYYLDAADREAFWTAVEGSLDPEGVVVSVHWVRPAPDYPVEGGQVQDELAERPGLERIVAHTEADFRLEVHTSVPPPARSVAQRVGLR